MDLWQCEVCGYIHQGSEPPELCPKCGASKDKFSKLSIEQSELIGKSRRTNDIHMEIVTLLEKVYNLSEEGSNINLDPGCKAIFEKSKVATTSIVQQIKAELKTHMNKGKWG